ncbi:MAG: class I SAM-dependent methyltransferase [Pararhizobium sp.]
MNLKALSHDITPPQDYEPQGTLRWDASLTDMADFFGSDKGTIKHNYTPVYDEHLAKLKPEPINLLEIGVACGASLKMWSRYFLYGKITGVDIRPECAELCKGYPSIEIKIADATKERMFGEWDVIIDDGSHIAGHIVKTFQLNWPFLKSGGKYFIEDLRCTYHLGYLHCAKVEEEGDKDRGQLLKMLDRAMRRCDEMGDVKSIHYTPQMLILEKR